MAVLGVGHGKYIYNKTTDTKYWQRVPHNIHNCSWGAPKAIQNDGHSHQTRHSSRESAVGSVHWLVSRAALIPICQCPSQEMSQLKIFWHGEGLTQTISELPLLRQCPSQTLSGLPPTGKQFSTLTLSTSHNVQLGVRVMQTIVRGYLGQMGSCLSCLS